MIAVLVGVGAGVALFGLLALWDRAGGRQTWCHWCGRWGGTGRLGRLWIVSERPAYVLCRNRPRCEARHHRVNRDLESRRQLRLVKGGRAS